MSLSTLNTSSLLTKCRMRWALAFAALATILRPTNVMIWIVVTAYTVAESADFAVIQTAQALLLESREALISG